MSLKKIPYHPIGVNIPAGLSDDPGGKVLMTAGPGMSTSFNGIENDLVLSAAWTIGFPPYPGPIFWVSIRLMGDERRWRTLILACPEPHGFRNGQNPPKLPAPPEPDLSALPRNKRVFGAWHDQYGNRPLISTGCGEMLRQLDGHNPDRRNSTGELTG
jgi:hypothetical protein